MPKANSTLDEELYAGLQSARKGKPLNFCLITDGPNVCKLIVQKKKISDGAAAKAKTESGGKAIIMGVVVGQGADLAFEVLDAEPSTKPQKIREFIDEQTEISCKPRWAVVTAMRVIDEDETSTTTTESPKETSPTTEGDGQAKTTSPEGDDKTTTPTPEPEFAVKARQSLVPREKTIKSGLEWAAKTKSPHEAALTEAYEAAKEKLAKAKTEGDFEAAVQAHDDVIALIRSATQEAAPTPEGAKPAVLDEKTFNRRLTRAVELLKKLLPNPNANKTELQRCAGVAKAADSHMKAKNVEQAAIALNDLQQSLEKVSKEVEEAYRKAQAEFQNHPDMKYISNSIREIWDWRGFDPQQKKAGLQAIAAKDKIAEAGKDLVKAAEFRDAAKIACQAWDKEVARVKEAAEAFNKLYLPHRENVLKAAGLARKKGLPKPVVVAVNEFRKPYSDFLWLIERDKYADATKDLDAVVKLAEKVVDTERSIGEAKQRFDLANNPLKAPFAEAKQFVQLLVSRNLNVGPTKKLCDDLTTADGLVNAKLTEFAYDDAILLLGGAKSAAEEVLKYKTEYDQAEQTINNEWAKIEPDLDFAREMPDANPTAIGDKQAMEQALDDFNDADGKFDYVAAAKLLDPLAKAVEKVKLAKEQLDREEGEFDTEWDTVNDDYDAVKNLGARDKKVQPLVDALSKAYNELLVPLQAYNYVAAKAKIADVRAAIQPLLVERPKQEAEWNKALKKVTSIYKKWLDIVATTDALLQSRKGCRDIWIDAKKLAGEGNFLAGKARLTDFVKAYDVYVKAVAAHNKVAEPKAKEARKQVEALVKKGELKNKSVEDKKKLLDALRGPTEMSKDDRKAQRLIYASLELDDDFLEEDKKKRKVIATKLTDTKAKRDELRDFRDKWGAKSLEDRLSIVRKALEAQCESMGFGDSPPEVITYSDPGSKNMIDNGYFNPNDGKIYLNTDPKASLSRDLESTLDLIFHENSHNYQDKLVKRLDPTSSDPLDPTDPEYNQAILFALNDGPHSYVEGEEDFQDYKKQPMEEHAHDNGPKTAKAVMGGLRAKKTV